MIHNKKKAGYYPLQWLLLCIAILPGLLVGCGEKRFQALEAQNFNLPLLEGDKRVSLEDFEGQVVYISF